MASCCRRRAITRDKHRGELRTAMYTFQITLHARPAEARCRRIGRAWRAGIILRWTCRPGARQRFGVSFEEASVALAQLPRMFIEPDGSFVWVSSSSEPHWQVDGVLYDRDERLLFVDLKGTCPATAFDQMLSAVDWPQTPVMLQLMREAVFVDEATFRAIAERARRLSRCEGGLPQHHRLFEQSHQITFAGRSRRELSHAMLHDGAFGQSRGVGPLETNRAQTIGQPSSRINCSSRAASTSPASANVRATRRHPIFAARANAVQGWPVP